MAIERDAENNASRHFRDRAYQLWLQAHTHSFRIALVFIIFAACAFVLGYEASFTSAATRYARAVRWLFNADHAVFKRDACDAALGRRRFWVMNVVTANDFCVQHAKMGSAAIAAEPGLRFQLVGDWGRDGMCCQHDVAYEMARAAATSKPRFIVSVGDNFYESGIVKATDAQVNRSWRNVYLKYEALKVPWKMLLGNHDYNGNVSAQEVLGRDDAFWHMPARYYFETFDNGGNSVLLVYLDTSVMYYMHDEFDHLWDTVDVEYRVKQLDDVRARLLESNAKWKIVVAHHPLFSSGENSVHELRNLKQMQTLLLPMLKECGVDAYISGHEHLMEHLVSDGVHFFVSGAGSKISSVRRNWSQSVFALDRQGFVDVVVSNVSDVMKVRMVDMKGAIVHRATLRHRNESSSSSGT
ncbi:Purple acid phosphatase 8 [Gracilariopsis chorda]|uniref:Purple acid phosphatase 8 n=1 Tax=Gracilariopsis chorda TaxID=448386 RepID=A0A2V3IYI4_9FLOR|nr:Purple acid phosphatase 8 [Gracilariopsis chorda]|eukprot:PXF47212.1 Purple acid phosphatase 8 [Gracilariopsis chorda]